MRATQANLYDLEQKSHRVSLCHHGELRNEIGFLGKSYLKHDGNGFCVATKNTRFAAPDTFTSREMAAKCQDTRMIFVLVLRCRDAREMTQER